MKFLLLLLVSLCSLPFTANAGNMFGPAPNRNGSPLLSGVDGTYQATARSENVTGIFRFAYSRGSQTSNVRQNSWVFFVNGQVLRGNVEANLNQSSLSGVLDDGGLISTGTNGALPLVLFSGASSSASGSFSGKLDQKSSSGAFNGSGTLLPTPPSTNVLTVIAEFTRQVSPTTTVSGIESTSVTNVNPGGTTPNTYFKFRGVRTSTPSPAVATPAN
jgi:hypothetical protein